MDSVINEYDKNEKFYGKILTDENVQNNFMAMMMGIVYNEVRHAP